MKLPRLARWLIGVVAAVLLGWSIFLILRPATDNTETDHTILFIVAGILLVVIITAVVGIMFFVRRVIPTVKNQKGYGKPKPQTATSTPSTAENTAATTKKKRSWWRPRKLAFVFLFVIPAIVIIAMFVMRSFTFAAPRTDPGYHENLTADDADADVVDVQKLVEENPKDPAARSFVVKAKSVYHHGSWGQKIILPETFRSGWCYQPYPAEDAENNMDWNVAFEFLNADGTVFTVTQPYFWGERPYFPHFPMEFRIQGSGSGILFQRGYRNARGYCVSSP